jgi:hypothetical protein
MLENRSDSNDETTADVIDTMARKWVEEQRVISERIRKEGNEETADAFARAANRLDWK